MIIDKDTEKLICDQLDTYVIMGEYKIADQALENLGRVIPKKEYNKFDKILDQKLGGRRIKYGFKNDFGRGSKIERKVVVPSTINL